MSLSPAFLDELRARTTLSTLIGRSIKLQKAGREYKAPCPFHNEKTPSFYVNDEKAFYHCLAAETLVVTRGGTVPIADLAGQKVDVLTRGGTWTEGHFSSFGTQRLWRVRLTRNRVRKTLYATEGHRWFVAGLASERTTSELRPGHCLEAVLPERRRDWSLDPEGVRHGIVFGDGTMYKGAYGTINLHGAKDAELAQWFPDQRHDRRERDSGKPYLRIYGGRSFEGYKDLPSAEADEAYLLGFLAGYLAADGHVSKDGTVMLNSARADRLKAVRDIALKLGIGTFGVTHQMRRGLGSRDTALHRIHLMGSTLAPEFFLHAAARSRFAASKKSYERRRWQVREVGPSDRIEEVFCAEVPDTHAFALDDNILTGNCFGCGVHGDAIRWLTDQRGLPFIDAVKELADAAGMEVPAADPRAQAKAEAASGLYDVMAAAQRWFEEQLAGIEGGEARAYLERRGIPDATRRKFGFGFAPDGRGKLRTALRDFGNAKLVESGLLIQPEEAEREPYDRFRGRLTYPIRDRRGRVIAFSARILGSGEPKYLNSPDTPLFEKGRSLFNIDKAAPASRQADRVIIVEGQMDVIALDQAGISEAVAPLGTALTEMQLELLWRLAASPILCFDGDAAGQKAAVRAALRALPHIGPGRSLGFVTLPPGQDPDDLVRAKGREGLEALLAEPEPLVDRLWRHESNAEPLSTPEERAGLRRRLLDHVSAIADADVRDQYRFELLSRFAALTRPGQQPRRPWVPADRFKPGMKGASRFAPPWIASDRAKAVGHTGLADQTARAVLAGLLRFPALVADHAEALAALPLTDAAASQLRDAMLEAAMLHGELDQEQLNTILLGTGAASLAETLRRERGLAFSFTRRDCDPERASRDLVLVLDTLAAKPGLDAALAAATARLKENADEAAFAEQQRLREARDEADRQLAALMESDAAE
jgi:DNA primase